MSQILYQSAEPTLGDLFTEIWRGKVYVLVGMGTAFVLALAFLFVSVPQLLWIL